MRMKPVYLFADSQPLFWQPSGVAFLERVKNDTATESPKAAYIGASNGDRPEFYGIFEAAMDGIGVQDRCMIRSEPSEEERASLEEADLILLAGGDTVEGWRVLEGNGVRDTVTRRYHEGAVLIGVSAGAVQLGLGAWTGGEKAALEPMFCFVPCFIDVHDEAHGWGRLRQAGPKIAPARALGIPSGGGLVYRAEDNSIEPLRHPLHEVTVSEGRLEERLLTPPEEAIDTPRKT
jgi:hypothetical protein